MQGITTKVNNTNFNKMEKVVSNLIISSSVVWLIDATQPYPTENYLAWGQRMPKESLPDPNI